MQRRIIGTDDLGAPEAPPIPTVNPILGDLSAAEGVLQRTAAIEQETSAIEQRTVQRQIETTAAISQAEQQKRQAGGGGIQQLMAGAQGLLEVFGQIEQRKAERDQARQEAQFDEGYSSTLIEAQEQLFSWRGDMRNATDENGMYQVREEATAWLQQNRDRLRPEDFVKIANQIESGLEYVQNQGLQDLVAEQRRLSNAEKASVSEQLRIDFVGQGALVDRGQMSVQEVVQNLYSVVSQLDNFTPAQKQELLADQLGNLAARAENGAEFELARTMQLNNTRRFNEISATARDQLEQGLIGYEQYRNTLAEAETMLSGNAIYDPVTAADALNASLEMVRLEEEGHRLANEQLNRRMGVEIATPNLVLGSLAVQVKTNQITVDDLISDRQRSMVESIISTFEDHQEGIERIDARLQTVITSREDAQLEKAQLQALQRNNFGSDREWATALVRAGYSVDDRGEITAKYEQASQDLRQLQREERTLLEQRSQGAATLRQYGLHNGLQGFNEIWEAEGQAEAEAYRELLAQQQARATTNFPTRSVNGTPPRALTTTGNVNAGVHNPDGRNLTGFVAPFGPDVAPSDVFVTAYIKSGSHGNGAAIDFAVAGNPSNVPVAALATGEVVKVVSGCTVGDTECGGRYGNGVFVRLQNGAEVWYNHLDRVDVQVGDVIRQGHTLGTMGSTGRSSGPHVDLAYRNPDGTQGDVINFLQSVVPEAHASALRPPVASLGMPPASSAGQGSSSGGGIAPSGAIMFAPGLYYHDGEMVVGENPTPSFDAMSPLPPTGAGGGYHTNAITPSTANPVRGQLASNSRNDYTNPNPPGATFGYEQLASKPETAAALNRVAQRLEIPTQWLVDIVAFESGHTFSPSVPNFGGAPAVGLIQFYEDHGDPGHKTVGGRRYSLASIANMSVEEQAELVYAYLEGYNYPTVEHLHMSIWGGHGRAFAGRSPRDLADMYAEYSGDWGDGDTNWRNYLSKLGSGAGRTYNTIFTQMEGGPNIHTQSQSGCSTCQALAGQGNFVAHTAA